VGADDRNATTTSVERVGRCAILVNIFFFGLNVAMAALSGGLTLAAEVVHNLTDLTAAGVVLVGLKPSQRQSRTFPSGLYKIENVVAVQVLTLPIFPGWTASSR